MKQHAAYLGKKNKKKTKITLTNHFFDNNEK